MKRKICLLVLLLISGCMKESHSDSFQLEKAMHSPYAPYPETITYTLANLTGDNRSNMPDTDTYENNAYTRYLKKTINIQNEDMMEESGTQYFDNVEMMIENKSIPDIMMIDDLETLEYLYDNDMIEDLSQAYEECTTKRIKAMYQSYDKSLLNNCKFNDKLYALPETNIDDGPLLFWVREDWLNRCQLNSPETLEDVEKIVETFIKKDMSGHNDTTSLLIDNHLTSENGYGRLYLLDLYFASFHVYPKNWIKDKSIHYDSINPDVKKALLHLHNLYKRKILDSQFLLRTSGDIEDEIINGRCGAFFGPWWAPNNPLIKSKTKDKNALWTPYLIKTDKTSTTYISNNPTHHYVVVRKGYEHPEIIFKMMSVLFDKARYEENVIEINQYDKSNVDPTARPVSMNVDYEDALRRSYLSIIGKKKEISYLNISYKEACDDYINHKQDSENKNWAVFTSRIKALSLLNTQSVKKKKSYFHTTQTMRQMKNNLDQLENETYLKIIIGELPVSYFDTFVKEWNRAGGEEITKEMNEGETT